MILFRSTKTFVHKKAGGSTVEESHEGYQLLVSVVTISTLSVGVSEWCDATTYLHGSLRSHRFKRGGRLGVRVL